MRSKKAVIYDIDNTLIDSSRRYEKALNEVSGKRVLSHRELNEEERERFWDIFLSPKYMYLDRPIQEVIEEANTRYEEGYVVIILTGRPYKLYRETRRQLEDAGVKYHLLVMRPDGDRDPDGIYKPRQIERLMRMGYQIIEYHDDSIDAIEAVKRMYPDIRVCRHGI